jgi:hypothetical protein
MSKMLAADVTNTDQEIRRFVILLFRDVHQNDDPFSLTISGFNDDSRGLYQIPEAVDLAKRLVAGGMMSLLHVATSLQTLERKPGWGALELWACAKGLFRSGVCPLSRETMQAFMRDLMQSNALCRQIIAEAASSN